MHVGLHEAGEEVQASRVDGFRAIGWLARRDGFDLAIAQKKVARRMRRRESCVQMIPPVIQRSLILFSRRRESDWVVGDGEFLTEEPVEAEQRVAAEIPFAFRRRVHAGQLLGAGLGMGRAVVFHEMEKGREGNPPGIQDEGAQAGHARTVRSRQGLLSAPVPDHALDRMQILIVMRGREMGRDAGLVVAEENDRRWIRQGTQFFEVASEAPVEVAHLVAVVIDPPGSFRVVPRGVPSIRSRAIGRLRGDRA